VSNNAPSNAKIKIQNILLFDFFTGKKTNFLYDKKKKFICKIFRKNLNKFAPTLQKMKLCIRIRSRIQIRIHFKTLNPDPSEIDADPKPDLSVKILLSLLLLVLPPLPGALSSSATFFLWLFDD